MSDDAPNGSTPSLVFIDRVYQALRRAEARRTRPTLYRCRICRVRVTNEDRAGHLERNHAGAEGEQFDVDDVGPKR